MKALITLVLSVLLLSGYSQSKLVKREQDKYTGNVVYTTPEWKGYHFLKVNGHLDLFLRTITTFKIETGVHDIYILFANGAVHKISDKEINMYEVSPGNFSYAVMIPFVEGDDLYTLLKSSYMMSFKLYIFEQKVKKVKDASKYLDAIVAAP